MKNQQGSTGRDEDIAKAAGSVNGKTEMDAVIAYLQNLGTVLRNVR